MSENIPLVVNRRKWARGHRSVLATRNGRMCIMGHMAVAAGIPMDYLVGEPQLGIAARRMDSDGKLTRDMLKVLGGILFRSVHRNPDMGQVWANVNKTSALASANDAHNVPLRSREARLIRLAATVGFDLSFTGRG